MQGLATILVLAFTCIGLAIGRPAGGPADAWEDCPGKAYYVCSANGFAGCCSVDPCGLSTCPDPRIGIPECTSGQHKLYQPSMHTVFPNAPDIEGYSVPDIQLAQSDNGTHAEHQVAVFSNIPTAAKNCGINWSIGTDPQAKFSVANTSTTASSSPGLVDVFAVYSSLPDNITWSSMSSVWGENVGHADFSFWPDAKRPQDHIVTNSLECNGTMAFMTGISGTTDGEVDLVQNEDSGWYLLYDC